MDTTSGGLREKDQCASLTLSIKDDSDTEEEEDEADEDDDQEEREAPVETSLAPFDQKEHDDHKGGGGVHGVDGYRDAGDGAADGDCDGDCDAEILLVVE